MTEETLTVSHVSFLSCLWLCRCSERSLSKNRYQRGILAQNANGNKDLQLTVVFAVQMFFAYMLMVRIADRMSVQ